MRQDQNLAGHAGVERAIRVRDATQRQSNGGVADEGPRGRECEPFRDESRHVFGSNQASPRTVLRDEDRSGLHQLAQVDVWKRARELSVVHEIAARCEETRTRFVRRGADRIEHGRRAAPAGVSPDFFDTSSIERSTT
jgi:hypothetical protein